ncbi:MAG TPA: DedA family protein [Ktedonobacteraceae bacterium]
MNVFFIDALQRYGYFVLWPIIFVAAVGAPISGNLLLFAAGAFVAFGDFNVVILFFVAVSAAVLGDNLGYFIGRRVGISLLAKLEQQKRFRWFSPENIAKGRAYFRKRTAWAVFLTRFLIVVFGGPINLLAGVEEYPYSRFLFWDVCGQILGAAIPLGLGYVFAASWEEVAGIFGTFSSFVLAFLVVGALSVMLIRNIRQYKLEKAKREQQSQLQLPEVQTMCQSDQYFVPISSDDITNESN